MCRSNYTEYESNGDKDKIVSTKEYLDEIKLYLNHNNFNTQGDWKIQLTMAINFFFPKDFDNTLTLCTNMIT